MNSHGTAADFEAYVTRCSDETQVSALESHVAACAECSAALAREARLDLSLYEVARAPAVPTSHRFRWAAGGIAALAAGLLAIFAIPRTRPERDGALEIRRCDGFAHPAGCIAQGMYDGVITIGPQQQLIIPRYDVTKRSSP